MDSKNHEDANRFNSVGNLFKKSGKYVQAVRAYRDAILCNPSFTNAKFNLAGSLHVSDYYRDNVTFNQGTFTARNR